MPLLLEGKRLAGASALDAGIAHRVVKAGEEIAAAEAWLLSSPEPTQPWDREDWTPPAPASVSAALEPLRRKAIEASLGHYPAIFAILDCVEFGLPQSFEGAIRSEMTSFSHLVLRPEPRAMIQTIFLGRVDYERLDRMHELPEVARARCRAGEVGAGELGRRGLSAGRRRVRAGSARRRRCGIGMQPGYWVEGESRAARRRWRCCAVSMTKRKVWPPARAKRRCGSPTTSR